jgi:CheY-like chemotaxis protein
MIKEKPIVVCRMGQIPEMIDCEETQIVKNPMECFSMAVSGRPELIAILFSARNMSARYGVLELCRCLKNNPLTKEIPVVVLMETIHREMMVKLQETGVTLFKSYKADIIIDLNRIRDLVKRGDPSADIREAIKKLCPSLNRVGSDDQEELTVCGAYMNRMVLGGKRLHEVCETLNHLHCEYFINSGISI